MICRLLFVEFATKGCQKIRSYFCYKKPIKHPKHLNKHINGLKNPKNSLKMK